MVERGTSADVQAPEREVGPMGQPVVHFEVVGSDGEKLRAYYAELFGWEFQSMGGPMNYGVVPREGNTNEEGAPTP
jgi:uncharacterized protein